MPQVYMILGPDVKGRLISGNIHMGEIRDLGKSFMDAVEKAFGIEGKNDVAFTAVSAECTEGEADFQVEIRYTGGEDEYGVGEPFDPTSEQQETLSDLLWEKFNKWIMGGGQFGGFNLNWTLSVWHKPFYKSHFHTGGWFYRDGGLFCRSRTSAKD